MRPWLPAVVLLACTFEPGDVPVGGDSGGPPDVSGDGLADAGDDALEGGRDGESSFCDPLDPDLALCLDFENEVVDGSSHAWPIEASGVTFVPGPPGRGLAARIDIGSLIRIVDAPGWAPSGERTWEMWVNPDFIPTGSGSWGILDKD